MKPGSLVLGAFVMCVAAAPAIADGYPAIPLFSGNKTVMDEVIAYPADGKAHVNALVVVLAPGETTVVTLGGTGATISGHAEATALVSGKEGARINGSLNTPPPQPPQGLKTPEEFQAWAELPEVKEAQKSFRSYAAEFKPDGTFSFDGVPPGEYTLSLMATMKKAGGQPWEVIQLGRFERPVSVPETAQNSVVTLDLGEMVLSPPLSPEAVPTP